MGTNRIIVYPDDLASMGVGSKDTCRKILTKIKRRRNLVYVTVGVLEEELGIPRLESLEALNPPRKAS